MVLYCPYFAVYFWRQCRQLAGFSDFLTAFLRCCKIAIFDCLVLWIAILRVFPHNFAVLCMRSRPKIALYASMRVDCDGILDTCPKHRRDRRRPSHSPIFLLKLVVFFFPYVLSYVYIKCHTPSVTAQRWYLISSSKRSVLFLPQAKRKAPSAFLAK